MGKGTIILIIVGVVILLLLCGGCSLVNSFRSTQNTLVEKEQAVQRGNSQYDGALDIITQKITGTWLVMEKFLDEQSAIYTDLAAARKRFDDSLAGDDPAEQVAAAQGFQLRVDALVESNPEIKGDTLAQQTSNALEEAVNEIFTAFQDWQDAVEGYNSYRKKLFMPVFVGGILGFPDSFEYYEGKTESFDINQYIPGE